MEDGPESTEGSYRYRGRTYGLVEHASEQWTVYDSDRAIGVLAATAGEERGPHYTVRLEGEDEFRVDTIDDWEAALEYLIDAAATEI